MNCCILSVLLLFISGDAYKILVYSNLFGHSHIKFLATVADILTDSGHDVTVLMPVIDVSQRNKTGLKSTKKQLFVEADEDVTSQFTETDKYMEGIWTADTADPMEIYMNSGGLARLLGTQCKKVMKSRSLLEQLKAEKFDLAITDPFDSCAYYIFEHLEIPAHVSVLVSTRMEHVMNAFGVPAAPSYVPSAQSVYGDRMSIWERFMNFLLGKAAESVFVGVGDFEQESAQEILGVTRSWRDILAESSFLLVNQIPILSFPSPTFDKIIPIGGMTVRTQKQNIQLSEKWDSILSKRPRNVLISFGSNVKSVDMPENVKNSLLTVFRSMPDTSFIWKYENSSHQLTRGIPNVHVEPWLPQNELLADPRLDVFITHGGISSVMELAMMGKPAVVVPIFADQARNAEMLKRHGGVEILDKRELGSVELLQKTLKKVLNNPVYRENAKLLAEKMRNQPTNQRETLIRHVEFAARFGKLSSMDPIGRRQSLIEYYLLDVILILGSLLFVSSSFLFNFSHFLLQVFKLFREK